MYNLMARRKDYYRTLGLKPGAGDDEIRHAYRDRVLKHHPDRAGGDAGKFREVQEAYDALSDRQRRCRLDGERVWQREAYAFEQDSAPFFDREPPLFDLFDDLLAGIFDAPRERSPMVEITLTCEEAREGVTIPLAVPHGQHRRIFQLTIPARLGRGRYHLKIPDAALPGGGIRVILQVA
jgi:DnaJ-class molecular chaperone